MAKGSMVESGIEKKLRELIVRCDEALRIGSDQQTNDDAVPEPRQVNPAMRSTANGQLTHRRMPVCRLWRREAHEADPGER